MRCGSIWADKQSLLWFPCSASFAARIGFTTQADAIDLPSPKYNPGRCLNRRWCSDWRPRLEAGFNRPPPSGAIGLQRRLILASIVQSGCGLFVLRQT